MKTIFAAALFAVGLAGMGSANAMPLAPLAGADTAGVIQVAQGCGPGFARGPYGRCRPMYRRGPVVVAPRAYVRPPVIVRRGPPPCRYGRCRY
ncbi:hypothetical protein HNR60_003473 [Rhodopseudomonas rhenobacensis]|uniref:PXPV repeat-containing protein n=1 Tax=Rhodopseudomonas rhenobacensis TaxID=87461 RepID=A0A7W7Z6H3_9BRAD|nr:hypothetical protein [Rhodopseudomonas rhenobacensis]MBB5048705.1 hypothetical protein [Rhodopseudomonas rhenobacensis]